MGSQYSGYFGAQGSTSYAHSSKKKQSAEDRPQISAISGGAGSLLAAVAAARNMPEQISIPRFSNPFSVESMRDYGEPSHQNYVDEIPQKKEAVNGRYTPYNQKYSGIKYAQKINGIKNKLAKIYNESVDRLSAIRKAFGDIYEKRISRQSSLSSPYNPFKGNNLESRTTLSPSYIAKVRDYLAQFRQNVQSSSYRRPAQVTPVTDARQIGQTLDELVLGYS